MEQVKNEKTFFEVFPTLRADGELKMLFQDVEVKKITTNSTREFLHIHMVSHHLIPKKVIWKMEQSIKEQLFGTASVHGLCKKSSVLHFAGRRAESVIVGYHAL